MELSTASQARGQLTPTTDPAPASATAHAAAPSAVPPAVADGTMSALRSTVGAAEAGPPPDDGGGAYADVERKVHMRIIPPMMALVIVSYIDRTNLAFASVQMNQQLGLSATVYGLGSGLFYLGYGAFQLPSNWLLVRFGGPRWLGLVCIVWGVIASSFALVRGVRSFLALRLLLGMAEAGAFPGMWYYVSLWYPSTRVTIPLSVIESGITVSQICGALFAAALLSLDGVAGLAGWQWVFLVEGAPAVLLGLYFWWRLPLDVASAPFLAPHERTTLQAAMHASSIAGKAPTSEPVAAPEADAAPEARAAPAAMASAQSPGCAGSNSPTRRGHSGSSGQRSAQRKEELAEQSSQPLLAGAARSAPAGLSAQGAEQQGSHEPGLGWDVLQEVLCSPIVMWAGGWRILHDLGGYALIMFTPLIVHSMVNGGSAAGTPAAAGGAATPAAGPCPDSSDGKGGGSEGAVLTVLLTAIPFTCASLTHLLNCLHSQRTGERRLHIVVPWMMGAVAMAALPLSPASTPAIGFLLLVVGNMGVNGANAIQTGWLVALLDGPQRALGLPVYNTVGNTGALLGPYITGVMHDTFCSYNAAMLVLGASLAGAAIMVLLFGAERWRGRRLCGDGRLWRAGGGRGAAGGGAQHDYQRVPHAGVAAEGAEDGC